MRSANGMPTASGYFTVFTGDYDMGANDERVSPTALDDSLASQPDVVFVVNHNAQTIPLARTNSSTGGPGSLELGRDDHGAFFRAMLDPEDPNAMALMRAIRNETIRGCSWAFRVKRDSWTKRGNRDLRTLEEVSIEGGDVSAVTFPASDATSIAMRSGTVSAARVRDEIAELVQRNREQEVLLLHRLQS